MTQNEGIALAKKFKKALIAEQFPVQSVFVFGSVARGDTHDNSDVDIAVIGTSFKGDRWEEATDIRCVRWPISYKIQPVWMYPEHFEDRFNGLAREIKKDGIEI